MNRTKGHYMEQNKHRMLYVETRIKEQQQIQSPGVVEIKVSGPKEAGRVR